MKEIEKLVEILKKYNDAYRSGKPLVSDHEYDSLIEELGKRDPDHPLLHSIEPETFESKNQVRHPAPMLSTEKAYSKNKLKMFLSRVEKGADEIGIKDIVFKVTPKLDGLAGRDDGKLLVSRGNGELGYDITGAFTKGVVPVGGRGLGVGEIVIVKSYFKEHFSDIFEHPRNMVVGIISSDTLNEFSQKALQDKMVHFVPYHMLPKWTGNADTLLNNAESITDTLLKDTDYPVDGVVAEVVNEELKAYMGATSHHYRWQLAIKTKGETAVSTVKKVIWQVGRTGNVTPVMEIEPVSVSGATIRRVTAHHAGLIREKGIGSGAQIEVIRSGEVIPKLERVIKPVEQVFIPSRCPVCDRPLEWNNDFLKCHNISCRAQIEQSISHWFKTIGNADWFGIKTIEKLVENGFDNIEKIYAMEDNDFLKTGFGPVQSKNLAESIRTSITKPVEDWRFLAAFGIPDLGKGDGRKLLSHIRLESLIETDPGQIEEIDGFGAITSRSIHAGIQKIKKRIIHMLSLGFSLEKTPLEKEVQRLKSPVAGKKIVFTGKMKHGSREGMQAEARRSGAKVQTSVSGKTDYLVCGEKVGVAKIEKAKKSGVKIISESEYFDMLKT